MVGKRVFFLLLVASVVAADQRRLEHRLWLLSDPVPPVTDLQQVGFDALIVPVGVASVAEEQASFKLSPQVPLESLGGFPVWALVWVEGEKTSEAAAEAFWNQVGPVVRGLQMPVKGLVLAARKWIVSLSSLARAVGKRASLSVEVASPAKELVLASSRENFRGLGLVALAFGNLEAEGFPPLAPYDAEGLLDALDKVGEPLRAGIVLTSRTEPVLPAQERVWSLLLNQNLEYQPVEGHDVFVAKGPVSMGSWTLPPGGQIQLQFMDGARLQRDLGLALRPVRHNLLGWDSVGAPLPEPGLGLSWQALVAFYAGAAPQPRPVLRLRWTSSTTATIIVENPMPFASAFGVTGNVVDLTFAGSEVKDLTLLAAVGADFGRLSEKFVRTSRGPADTVRFYLKMFPPRLALEAAVVHFVARPSHLAARFVARLGDGREVSGVAPILGP